MLHRFKACSARCCAANHTWLTRILNQREVQEPVLPIVVEESFAVSALVKWLLAAAPSASVFAACASRLLLKWFAFIGLSNEFYRRLSGCHRRV
jgi:hypothetical protein